jgi:hypothetical protein
VQARELLEKGQVMLQHDAITFDLGLYRRRGFALTSKHFRMSRRADAIV